MVLASIIGFGITVPFAHFTIVTVSSLARSMSETNGSIITVCSMVLSFLWGCQNLMYTLQIQMTDHADAIGDQTTFEKSYKSNEKQDANEGSSEIQEVVVTNSEVPVVSETPVISNVTFNADTKG